MRAAIEAGADAVYFGLKHFSARAKTGFALDELPEAVRLLHQRGVRGYLTFNTLVFEHEFQEAARAIAAIAEAGVDAMIVQDYGIARLVRKLAPEMELHASTQMSVTDAQGVRLAQSFGIRRVTLARELSLNEIRSILAETGCELEIFVHGALCVAYSGQCFSSEAWGGRSANRGQCAQACRLPYELLVDGELHPLADARYLLSPGDLMALRQVPEIVDMGIAALKIEGRYKDATYVALTTRAYRKAVDEAWAGRECVVSREEALQLEQVYSRGLGPYFLSGTNHQTVVRGRAPRHRGVLAGRVVRVETGQVVVDPAEVNEVSPLKPGDGIVFDAAGWRSPQEPEEGARIYAVTPGDAGVLHLTFGRDEVHFDRIRPGDLVWRTHDPGLERIARPYLQPAAPVAKQPVDVHVVAREGEPLVAEWSLARQHEFCVTVRSAMPSGAAQSRALTEQSLREQFERLGNTPYQLAGLTVEVTGSPFVPVSLLNRMRRDAVRQLQEFQGRPRSIRVEPARALLRPESQSQPPASGDRAPALHLLVRAPEQLEAAILAQPSSITLDYLDLYGLRPSVERVKSAGILARVSSPRVAKPGESRILQFLAGLDCQILVRAAGMLEALRGLRHQALIGDFSLNAANSLAAEALLDLGLARVTPTHDLNADQVAELARRIGGERIEAVAYQHMPVFHTEHCVFCRFLSTGTSYRDCGRPCERHRVSLRDSGGRAHPVMADVGCRNTVFSAEAQSAGGYLEAWLRAGIRDFRLEFVHESAGEVRRIAGAFELALSGRLGSAPLNAELKRIAPQGITEGSLFVPNGYRELPILQ